MNLRMLGIVILSTGLAGTAKAQPEDVGTPSTGPYIGAGYGVAFIDKLCHSTQDNPANCKDTDDTWRGIVGYRFNPYLGIEGAYVHLADFDKHVGPLTGKTRVTGPEATLVGYLPFNRYVSAYARGGLYFWHVKSDVLSGSTTLEEKDEHGHDPVGGLGLQASLTDNVKMQLEWDHYFDVGHQQTTGQSDVDTVGLNAILQF